MKTAPWILLVAALAVHCAVAQEPLSEPERNFEHLWQTFDRNYALFGAKHVDWDALYAVYRPRVTPETGDDELFEIMAAMLGHLNDNHVRLMAGERRFTAGILNDLEMDDFSLELVLEKYLKGEATTHAGGIFHSGWLTEGIGYVHLRGFGQLAASTAAIDEIVHRFRDARGIVFDVRGNGGGDDRVGKAIADRFADTKRLYMTTRVRNGPEHDDFSGPKIWHVEPGGPLQFTGPVILLTHRHSVSAAENFALAMRVIPHVTVVGDTTSGVFADVYGDTLPNGWGFSCSFKLFEDYTGFCWEGIGVPADLRQVNRPEDLAEGRDRVIELAIALVNSGSLRPQPEPASLLGLRDSLVDSLRAGLEAGDPASAVAAFGLARSTDPQRWYVDEDELEQLADELLLDGRADEAAVVARLRALQFPGSPAAHLALAEALADLGDRDAAVASYRRAQEVNRRSFPWGRDAAELIDQILAGKRVLVRELEMGSARGTFDDVVAAYDADPGVFVVQEAPANTLGYQLLGSGRVDEAIEVFRINTLAFPESWNVWDSLGEAYMTRGDTALAIVSYERSVEVNPQNTNGIEMLQRLRGAGEQRGQ